MIGLVSSDPERRRRTESRLARLGFGVSSADTGDAELLRAERPALYVYEPAGEPLARLADVVRAAGQTPVILMSDALTTESAIAAVKIGATNCLDSMLEDHELKHAIEQAVSPAQLKLSMADSGLSAIRQREDFITASPAMAALKETAARIADADVTVLIHGESGVGKEVLARHIHSHSQVATGPFVKVNCAALPEELLESELFGHERGAFTGATRSRPGKFELANDGTILLDEISEMKLALQAKLLHVLQDGTFTRIGGTRELRSNARVCSATNQDLEKAIEAGRFREDLYFRLKVIDLFVPPLRQRPEDIDLLVDHFLDTFSAQYNRPRPRVDAEFRSRLRSHPWYGNVRELANVMKGIVVMGDLGWAESRLESKGRRTSDRPAPRQTEEDERPSLKEIGRAAAAAAERVAIVEELERTRWNRRRTARNLKVSYKTLLSRMKAFGLTGDRQ